MEIQNTTPSPSLLTTHSGHRACATCVRAKAKCVPGEGGKCQRCQRLLKICEPVQNQPRSLPRKRKNESASRIHKSQVEKLEEKLDGLVTLLQSSQESKASNESSVPAIFDASPTTPRPYSDFNPLPQPLHGRVPGPPWIRLETANGSGSSQPSQHSDDHATTSTAATSDYDLGPKIPDCVEFTSDQANAILNRFRNEMSPFFPFVIVSPSMSAEDLQRDRPFLLKSILAVASPVSEHQVTLGKWLVRQLTERMAINGERNLDLLLGVLTYTAWCLNNCYNIPQITLLLSLGMALIFDLGLNRPTPGDPSSRSLFEIALREANNPTAPILGMHTKTSRSLEDRRVFLGLFFLTSVFAIPFLLLVESALNFIRASKIFRCKMDPLKITPYIYECLDVLDKAHDHKNDTCATSLVRLQLIVERIGQGPWNNEFGTPEGFGSAPPPMLYLKSLQEQLKSFRSAMPPELKLKGYILMHYYYAEETLYEVGLSRSPLTGNFSPHDFHRLELLHACLQSNKMFFETFFAIPESKYTCFSLATCTQLTHSLIVLQLLSNFEHPDWNLVYARETIGFMEIMDKMIGMFSKLYGWIFAHTTAKLARIKAHIQEKWAVQGAGPGPVSLSGEDADMGRTWEPVDFLDEFWVTDVLGSIDSQLNSSGIP